MRIKSLSLPSLKRVGNFFVYHNKKLTSISLPALETFGEYFLGDNNMVTAPPGAALTRNI